MRSSPFFRPLFNSTVTSESPGAPLSQATQIPSAPMPQISPLNQGWHARSKLCRTRFAMWMAARLCSPGSPPARCSCKIHLEFNTLCRPSGQLPLRFPISTVRNNKPTPPPLHPSALRRSLGTNTSCDSRHECSTNMRSDGEPESETVDDPIYAQTNVAVWVLTAASGAFLLVRIWCRHRFSKLWWDDGVLLLSWVRNTTLLCPSNPLAKLSPQDICRCDAKPES